MRHCLLFLLLLWLWEVPWRTGGFPHQPLAARPFRRCSTTLQQQQQQQTEQAGRDGYSILRQPLSRGNWDPTVDPKYDTMERKRDAGQQQQSLFGVADSAWWETKQQASQKQASLIKKNLQQQQQTQPALALTAIPRNLSEPMDLLERTFETLEFPYILRALQEQCRTTPGKKIVRECLTLEQQISNTNNETGVAYAPLFADSARGARERYQAVQEMQWLLSSTINLDGAYYKDRNGYQVALGNGLGPPMEGVSFDLDAILEVCDDDKDSLLEGPEILAIVEMMKSMENIQLWSLGLTKVKDVPSIVFEELPKYVHEIHVNSTLLDLCDHAFDKQSRLSGTTFPVLGRLRNQVATLKSEIIKTIEYLVESPSVREKLALESGGPLYSEIANGGRLVIPIAPKYASSMGIVHDSSRSGKTVYVEPREIIGPTNDLRHLEGELRQEESRIWQLLTDEILRNRDSLEQSVQAVGQLDVAMAKYYFSQKVRGVIPEVGDAGVVNLKEAKHPLLLLKNRMEVTGSDIEIGIDGNQGLVLTGPNSGGKTVILKFIGLAALMVRCGIPVPAQPGDATYSPRVDYFDPVLADIGDIQSVDSDLSTFSGHMLVCREVLRSSSKDALVLMDELGSGTDPAQGVAIAQAILESLVDRGCRVVVTTHYSQLKQLALSDKRFAVAGMQFLRGRPTYKMLRGMVGESFALAVAERLELPQDIIDRATMLMDEDTRRASVLVQELEDQKVELLDQLADLEAKQLELAELKNETMKQKRKLDLEVLRARREEAGKFAAQLEEKESVLRDILKQLKSNPSSKVIAKSWESIKVVRRDVLREADDVAASLVEAQEDVDDAELVPLSETNADLKQGDRLLICKSGNLYGREAIFVKSRGKRIEVTVAGVPMSMKLNEVAYPGNVEALNGTGTNGLPNKQQRKQDFSAAAAKLIQDESLSVSSKGENSNENNSRSSVVIRTASNTIDVRGCTLEGAKEKITDSISNGLMQGQSSMFILHGHGTNGALKSKIRAWLRTQKGLAKSWKPADTADGGDAFTLLLL